MAGNFDRLLARVRNDWPGLLDTLKREVGTTVAAAQRIDWQAEADRIRHLFAPQDGSTGQRMSAAKANASLSGGAGTEDDLDASAGALEDLPRYPGWLREDWRPAQSGPVRAMALHRQTQPDRDGEGEAMAFEASPWRFELGTDLTHLGRLTIVGRLDQSALRLMIRSDQPLGPGVRENLQNLVTRMTAGSGRPVTVTFDLRPPAAAPAKQRAGVDRRA